MQIQKNWDIFRLNQSDFDWNSEDEDEDNDEPKVEKYIVEGEADKPLSGPLQKSADPIFTVISRLIHWASAEDVVEGDKANALRPVARR